MKYAAIYIALVAGCASTEGYLRDITAMETGCPRDDVRVIDDARSMATWTWNATCGRTVYQCVQQQRSTGGRWVMATTVADQQCRTTRAAFERDEP